MSRGVGVVERGASSMARAASLAKSALAGIGVGISVAGLTNFVRSGINAADTANRLAKVAGTTTEAFTALAYGASLSDVSNEKFAASLKFLGKNMDEASRGSKKAVETFQRLGVSVVDAEGKLRTTDAVFADVAESLSKLPDGAAKGSLAMKAFGKAGADLIPFLNEGRAGIAALSDEAQRLGKVLDTATGEAADKFNDNLDRMKLASEGLALNIAADLLPALTRIAEATREAYVEAGALTAAWVALGGVASELTQDTALQASGKRADALRDQIKTIEAQLKAGTLDPENKSILVPNVKLNDEGIASLRKNLAGYKAELAGVIREQMKLVQVPPKKAEARTTTVENKAADDEAAKAAEKRAEREADAIRQLGARIVAERDVTELAKVRYEIEKGSYKDFSAASKERLKALASELDILKDQEESKKESLEVSEYLRDVERDRQQDAEKAIAAKSEERKRVLESLRSPEEQYAAEIKKLLDLGIGGPELQRGIEQARQGLDSVRNAAKETNDVAKEIGLTFESAFEDAIVEGAKFSDVLRGIEKDLLRLGTRKLVTEPLTNFFGKALDGLTKGSGGGGGGGGGILQSLTSMIGGFFGGARAGGGPVSSGKAYLVGENEPEMFFPNQAGTIVPMSDMGGGGTVVNVNFAQIPRNQAEITSATQQAARVGQQVRRAIERNG